MDIKIRMKWLKAMKRFDPFGDKSKVYWCEDHFGGANSHGQLGLEIISEQVETPTKVAIGNLYKGIKQVACGGGHSLLLDTEGKLYSCGWNTSLQLGTENESYIFHRVWPLSGVTFTNIACGWNFSYGVTDDKFLFIWGSNSYSQLGLPAEHFSGSIKPIKLQINAVAVSAGLRHAAIVNSKGEVWVTGYGKHGQLGLGKEKLSSDRFQRVHNIGKISHIACGQNHTVAWCSEERSLYVWGDNRHGQLLLDNVNYKKIYDPQKIDIDIKQSVKRLLSGWTNILLWLEDGTIYTWGRNNYGQLGVEHGILGKKNHLTLPGGRTAQDIALGSEHTICLANDNTLWAWGWNEHANTGIKSESEHFVKIPTIVPIQGLGDTAKITKVYAGGGHNFVVVE